MMHVVVLHRLATWRHTQSLGLSTMIERSIGFVCQNEFNISMPVNCVVVVRLLCFLAAEAIGWLVDGGTEASV